VARLTLAFNRGALLLAVAAFGLVAQPSAANPLEDGQAAYANGDFDRALQLLRPLAEDGNAGAQFWLGMMYRLGEGVTPSRLHAHVWFSLSMSNSDARSEDFQDAMDALDLTERSMTSAEIALAREMAYRCQSQNYKNCN
jgi:TPR repeat protein